MPAMRLDLATALYTNRLSPVLQQGEVPPSPRLVSAAEAMRADPSWFTIPASTHIRGECVTRNGMYRSNETHGEIGE